MASSVTTATADAIQVPLIPIRVLRGFLVSNEELIAEAEEIADNADERGFEAAGGVLRDLIQALRAQSAPPGPIAQVQRNGDFQTITFADGSTVYGESEQGVLGEWRDSRGVENVIALAAQSAPHCANCDYMEGIEEGMKMRPAPLVADSREALHGALVNVVSNAMSYPEAVQSRILGQDTGPFRERLVEALLASGVVSLAADHICGDEYHTLAELYEYRMAYHAHAARGWLALGIPVVKSWRHSDGEPCFGGGWFIVSAALPSGQVTNHYKAKHWELFDVPEVDVPPAYDGHTPQIALQRILEPVSLAADRSVDDEVLAEAEAEAYAPNDLEAQDDFLTGWRTAGRLAADRDRTMKAQGWDEAKADTEARKSSFCVCDSPEHRASNPAVHGLNPYRESEGK